ncbi:MAG: glycosyltransferase family 4 protein [Campylobacterales bacterium]|nr:glycosyltransferase family 4 protein [Campylobacterales bacterium]
MVYLFLFLLSFSLTYFIKEYAKKKSLVAKVTQRSSHTAPTPHGGGVAIAFSWFVGLIYLYLSHQIDSTLFFALMLGIGVAVVGLIDDIVELSPKIRMVAFGAVGVGGLFVLGGLKSLDFGFFSIENQLITFFFALLLVLWYINLTNFIDGINGYVGTQFVFLSVAGALLFGGGHFVVLAMAVLGFLYWNFGNAKIFMGDVGSTLLGYSLAIITLYYANIEALNLWIWITLYGLFWLDATVTLVRRKLNGEKLSQAHKKHAYQRLTQANWSHRRVTLYALTLNIGVFALIYFVENIAISFAISIVLFGTAYGFVETKKKFETSKSSL